MTTEKLNELMAQLAIGQAELQKEVQESLRKLSEAQAKTECTVDRVTASIERVHKSYGGLSNSIGEIVEMIIIPGLKGRMSEFKHTFTIASPRREYFKPDGGQLTEIDLLLENCEEVMVVEVKTQFSLKWVNRHLKKLELLRKNERITGMSGKTMYAAIAGINFDDDARALAVENGMYIIEMEEDDDRINVIPPAGKAGTW